MMNLLWFSSQTTDDCWRTVRLVLVLVLSACTMCEAQSNYCDLCDNHVACGNGGNFGAQCSADRALLKITPTEKEHILKLHNRMRNAIALGQVPGYSAAGKMPTLKWDNELAYLAELNARSCIYGHDSCRATAKFRWAGQNIARRGNTKGYEKLSDSIKYMITDWFTEYKDAGMDYIDSYHNHVSGKKIGHFTIMVNDKNDAVGCALSRFQENGFKYNYLVCNYAYTNILQRPVYEKGATASKCKKRSPVYKGLCSADQKVSHVP